MSNKQILIVDDDETFSNVLSSVLVKRGYEVWQCNQIDQLMPAVEQQAFDVILLDLMLADHSSLGYISRIRKAQTQARIIVLTGYASIPTTVKAIKLGADDYLAKPVGVHEIMTLIAGDEVRENDTSKPMPLRRVEWEHIQRVLDEHNGNISAAAESLGLHRRTLQRKLMKKPAKD